MEMGIRAWKAKAMGVFGSSRAFALGRYNTTGRFCVRALAYRVWGLGQTVTYLLYIYAYPLIVSGQGESGRNRYTITGLVSLSIHQKTYYNDGLLEALR